MANNSGAGLSVDEISGDLIKNELGNVVQKLTGSKNVQLSIEPGSKKGNFFPYLYDKIDSWKI